MSYPGGEHDPYSGEPVPLHYSGGSAYQGFGAFEPPPRRSRVGVIIGAITGVLGATAVGAYFLLSAGGGEDPQAAPTGEPTSPTSTPTATSSSISAPTPSSAKPSRPQSSGYRKPDDLAAVVNGWQAAFSAKEGVAYDVSSDWTVETPTTLAGFENDSGERTIMHGVATYRDGFCDDDSNAHRGRAGFMTANDLDPAKITPAAVKIWATAAGDLPKNSSKVTPSKAQQVDIHGGKKAWMSTGNVRYSSDSECEPGDLTVTAVAFKPRDSGMTALFILFHDNGVDNQLPAAEAKKIIGSLRAAGGD